MSLWNNDGKNVFYDADKQVIIITSINVYITTYLSPRIRSLLFSILYTKCKKKLSLPSDDISSMIFPFTRPLSTECRLLHANGWLV